MADKTYPTAPPQQSKLKPVAGNATQPQNKEKLAEKISNGDFMKGIGGLTAMTRQLVSGNKLMLTMAKSAYAQDRTFYQKMNGWGTALLETSVKSANDLSAFSDNLLEMAEETRNKALDVSESKLSGTESKSPMINIINKIGESGGFWEFLKNSFKLFLISASVTLAGIIGGAIVGIIAASGVGAAIAGISLSLQAAASVFGKKFEGLNTRFLNSADKFIQSVSGGASKFSTWSANMSKALKTGVGLDEMILNFFAKIEKMGGLTGRIGSWLGNIALDIELSGGLVTKVLKPLRRVFDFFKSATGTFSSVFSKLSFLTKFLRFIEPLMKRLPLLSGVINVLSHIGDMFAAFDSKNMVDSIFKLFRDIPKYFLSGLAGVIGLDVGLVEEWFDGLISDSMRGMTRAFTKLFSGDGLGFVKELRYVPITIGKWILKAGYVVVKSVFSLIDMLMLGPLKWVLKKLGFTGAAKSIETAWNSAMKTLNLLPDYVSKIWASITNFADVVSNFVDEWLIAHGLKSRAKKEYIDNLGPDATEEDKAAYLKSKAEFHALPKEQQDAYIREKHKDDVTGTFGDKEHSLFRLSKKYREYAEYQAFVKKRNQDRLAREEAYEQGLMKMQKTPLAVDATNKMQKAQDNVNRVNIPPMFNPTITQSTVKSTTVSADTYNSNTWVSPRNNISPVSAF